MSDKSAARELQRRFPGLKYQTALQFVQQSVEGAKSIKATNPEKTWAQCLADAASKLVDPVRLMERTARFMHENGPRLQNIPVRTETGKRIREAFVDNHGVPIAPLNFNQVELRVMSSMVEDFKRHYPDLARGMTEDEILSELVRPPAKSVQAFTKIAKDTKSTGRRPKGGK